MEEMFLKKEISSLIEKVDTVDQKPLNAYIKMIGNPKNVEEFLEIFRQSIEKGKSSQTICFKIIEKFKSKEFFTFVLDAVKETQNSIQAQTALKSTVAIPDDIKIVEEYIKVIMDLIKNIADTEVLYHGVCLIYRIVTRHPELEKKLEETHLILRHEDLEGIIKKFDILDKWQTEGHRGKSKPGYFQEQTAFINFAMKFIKFQ